MLVLPNYKIILYLLKKKKKITVTILENFVFVVLTVNINHDNIKHIYCFANYTYFVGSL